MRKRAEALVICTKKLICFPKPENPYLSIKCKVILNCKGLITELAQRSMETCSAAAGKMPDASTDFSRADPTANILWFKGSSSKLSTQLEKAMGWWLIGCKLHWIKFQHIFWEHTGGSFGLHGFKRRNQSSACLVQYAPFFKAVFKDILPHADMHVRCCHNKGKKRSDYTLIR